MFHICSAKKEYSCFNLCFNFSIDMFYEQEHFLTLCSQRFMLEEICSSFSLLYISDLQHNLFLDGLKSIVMKKVGARQKFTIHLYFYINVATF